ncbi:hypothetical protein BDY21DRAFT_375308 [Lineolata rhizophorae]|uniref:DUF1989 domain-containing protein n=1 Tax=Lineolata rhizophorae TaxID=578093 RepID=A0A6A6NLW5_9PEZI|nr:hypothetical protein BDY21DRAFT_375308 [Lineolata rhizophorae]
MPSQGLIPARRGAATIVKAGQTIKVINASGHQVVDTWCFALRSSSVSASSIEAPLYPNVTADSPKLYSEIANVAASAPEFMSMSHTRASLGKLTPAVGDSLFSQKRAPMLTLVEDTSPGVHDTLMAACDRWRYSGLGVKGYHESCTDNCWDALAQLAESPEAQGVEGIKELQTEVGGRVPDPFNLFMNIPAHDGEGARRALTFEAPLTKPGDYVCLKALRDVIVAMSSCPQDILSINGGMPKDAHFEVF